MVDVIHLARNWKINSKIRSLIKEYKLKVCYKDDYEKIFKNSKVIIRISHRCVSIYIFSDNNLYSSLAKIFYKENSSEK